MEAYLYIRVPSVNPKVGEPLLVDTDNGSVTIGWFRGMHNHFDWQRDYQQAAIEHIADVLSDSVTYSIVGDSGERVVRSWLGGRDEN